MIIKKVISLSRRARFLTIAGLFVMLAIAAVSIITLRPSKTTATIKNTTVPVQGGAAKTPDVFSVSPSNKQVSYSSPSFKANYEFNAIAPHWKESDTTESNREVKIRTSADGKNWSEWTPVEVMHPLKDNAPYADQVFPEAPIIVVGKFFEYKVDLKQEDGKSPKIEAMNVTYIDSRPSAIKKLSTALHAFLSPTASASTQTPTVISRAGWGSPDPDGNGLKGQALYWAPTYKPVKQVFIHHTVDSDYSSYNDGASVVRAIYDYQTNTLGWGDIGYNYLVDQTGKTYEGRAHGDNIVAGHTYEYNQGSMAIALIGCFQPNNSSCQQLNNNATAPPSSAMLDSLTTMLAWNTTNFEIDPQAQQVFCKSDGVSGCLNLYTIAGHRDAQATACPGDIVYQDLQTIRSITASKKGNGFSYSAKQVNYPTVTLGNNNQVSVTLQFKNTGTGTWYNSGPNPINLATANGRDHVSAFRGNNWLNGARPATLTQSSVIPGATGSFTFNVSSPASFQGQWQEYFGLVAEGNTHFGNFFTLPITTRNFSYTYSSHGSYTDSSKTTPVDLNTLSPGQSAWLVLKIVNTSDVAWSNSGPNPVNLGTDGPRDRMSRFCTSAWLNCARPAKLTEATVAPGAIGTYEFPISVPAGGGTFNEYFTPVVEWVTWMNYVGIYYPLRVNTTYTWNQISQTAYTDSSKTTIQDLNNLSPGQNFYLSLTAKNTGSTTWYNNGPYPMSLGTSHPQDRASAFRNSSWVSLNRVSLLKETVVSPGQNGTFEGTFTAPSGAGTYKEYLQPVAEYVTWLNDLGTSINATVKVDYSWSLGSQQAFTDATQTAPVNTSQLAKGQRFYVVVTATNTGTSTWYNNGPYPVRLGTSGPRDRTSLFYDNTWVAINRPGSLSETSVPPGGTGHFVGYFTAPNQYGTYKEYLQPVAEYVTWLNDLGLYFQATVQ